MHATHERLTKFRYSINKHNETRLDKYNKRKSKSQDVKITELQRLAPFMEYFSAFLSVHKFKQLYSEIEKNFKFVTEKNLALD